MENRLFNPENIQVFSWTFSVICFALTWQLQKRQTKRVDWRVIAIVLSVTMLLFTLIGWLGLIGLFHLFCIYFIAVSVSCLATLCYYEQRWTVFFLSVIIIILLNSIVLNTLVRCSL